MTNLNLLKCTISSATLQMPSSQEVFEELLLSACLVLMTMLWLAARQDLGGRTILNEVAQTTAQYSSDTNLLKRYLDHYGDALRRVEAENLEYIYLTIKTGERIRVVRLLCVLTNFATSAKLTSQMSKLKKSSMQELKQLLSSGHYKQVTQIFIT